MYDYHISLNWLVVYVVVHDGQNSVGVKKIVLQNMISGCGPLNQLLEKRNACRTVGDVSVHTTVRLQTVDVENISF